VRNRKKNAGKIYSTICAELAEDRLVLV